MEEKNINKKQKKNIQEKVLKAKPGMPMLITFIVMHFLSVFLFVKGIELANYGIPNGGFLIVLAMIWFFVNIVLYFGLKVIKPQEALVLTLFGEYSGTLKETGFYFVNPFSTGFNPAANTFLGQSGDVITKKPKIMSTDGSTTNAEFPSGKKISLKVMTLNNAKQKINDRLGNPVEVGIAVMWRVVDTAKAVFEVDNYKEFLSLQCDSSLRDIVRIYPYDSVPGIDTTGDGEADEGSLRGSSSVVAQRIKEKIQERVNIAGIEIIDARITYLAYAPEIAAAMLQRQQAAAVVDARATIVDGAVGMVEMALDKLSEKGVVELDEDKKATMVSNLMVVLCSNKDTQPVVNSGSLY
ncbi:putative family [Peptoniphilus sp. ING2-D1G]|nr:putative family [Peptoniphilus sp. ING2-D1G]